MEYKAFKEQLKKEVEKLLKKGDRVLIHSDCRPNDVVRESINIMSSGQKYSPAIDINSVYEFCMENDYSIEEIADNLVKFVDSSNWNREIAEKSSRIVDDIFDLEKVRHCIYIALLNRDMNQRTLQNLPSVPFLDMEATFFVSVSVSEEVNAVVRVTHDMMNEWEIGVDELFETGLQNMREQSDFKIRRMEDIVDFAINIAEVECCDDGCECGAGDERNAGGQSGEDCKCGIGDERGANGQWNCVCRNAETENIENPEKIKKKKYYVYDGIPSGDMKMYPVFDKTMRNGSAVMLLPEVLQDFAGVIGGDFIILPSSVNEVILMKDPGQTKYEEFKRIVGEVNSIVHKPEILSYSVYKFSCSDNQVSIVA